MTADSRVLRPPLWYKDAVIYEVHVRAFADSSDDVSVSPPPAVYTRV